MGKVEERLWSIIRSFADLGRDRPAMLVNAVRIIELQELVDRSLESSSGGAKPLFRKQPVKDSKPPHSSSFRSDKSDAHRPAAGTGGSQPGVLLWRCVLPG